MKAFINKTKEMQTIYFEDKLSAISKIGNQNTKSLNENNKKEIFNNKINIILNAIYKIIKTINIDNIKILKF